MIDDAILRFAETMQYKLDLNKDKECDQMNPDGKGRTWKRCNVYWLFYRLKQEIVELETAIYEGDGESAIKETGDVGNFTMMIHDNLQRLRSKK